MIKSPNQLRLELSEIATDHLQINDFFWGDFLRAYKENELNYPLMGAFYPSAGFLKNQTSIQLTVYVADKLFDSWSNLNEVESDTLQVCRDIFQIINSSVRWQSIGRVDSCSVTKFIDKGGDGVAGHQMVFNFMLRDRDGICNIPIENYDFDQVAGSVCYAAIVENSDASYQATVASGGTLVLPNTSVVLKNSALTTISTTSLPSSVSGNITAPDGTAKNSDNSYSVSVPSGATVTMPDINFTDSNGITTQVPSNIDIVASACGAGASVGMKLMKTGQTISYRTGDDGDIEAGRATSFTILASNNPFGNTNRFTDELGTQTYTNNIVIDWSTYDGSTVLGYKRTVMSSAIWDNQIDNCLAVSIGSFTSGWRLWNAIEAINIVNFTGSILVNYSPMNISGFGGYCHTSTNFDSSFTMKLFAQGGTVFLDRDAKANSASGVAVRTFTVTGTTLS
jgi:hypothetical protein